MTEYIQKYTTAHSWQSSEQLSLKSLNSQIKYNWKKKKKRNKAKPTQDLEVQTIGFLSSSSFWLPLHSLHSKLSTVQLPKGTIQQNGKMT